MKTIRFTVEIEFGFNPTYEVKYEELTRKTANFSFITNLDESDGLHKEFGVYTKEEIVSYFKMLMDCYAPFYMEFTNWNNIISTLVKEGLTELEEFIILKSQEEENSLN